MLRRQTRQRREFLYKKALEAKEKGIHDRKERAKHALAAGKAPQAKQGEETENGYDYDDEYSQAGVADPKVLITTSRDPSSRLQQFAKEMRLIFPHSHRINRGNYVMKDLAEACRTNNMTDLVVLHEHRGVPDAIVVSHFPHGPTCLFTLHNVVLRHETPNMSTSTVSEQYPHLIFDDFSSKLGDRISKILKFLFPVPKKDSKRVMTFSNDKDFISFRHHVFVKTSYKEVQLAEVGPRFEMRPYEIKQGTIEQTEADVEWVLRPYMRSARKSSQL